MKIYKTKWYIVRSVDKSFHQLELVNLWYFNSLEELKANHHFNPHKHLAVKGERILQHPERYGVIENREEFLTVDDIRTKAVELAQHLAADGGSGYQVAEIPQLSDSALYYWLAGWGCEWNGQEWLNPEDPE